MELKGSKVLLKHPISKISPKSPKGGKCWKICSSINIFLQIRLLFKKRRYLFTCFLLFIGSFLMLPQKVELVFSILGATLSSTFSKLSNNLLCTCSAVRNVDHLDIFCLKEICLYVLDESWKFGKHLCKFLCTTLVICILLVVLKV